MNKKRSGKAKRKRKTLNKYRPVIRVSPQTSIRPSAELIEQMRDYVRDLKQQYSQCADCELDWPGYVLEFDHIDATTKCFNIGRAKDIPSMDALIEEINKCDLVCSNCHKIREFQRKIKKPPVAPESS